MAQFTHEYSRARGPAPPSAALSQSITAPGWCFPCYEAGQFVPAWLQPDGTVCRVHAAEAVSPPPADPRAPAGAGSRPGGRTGPSPRGPGRAVNGVYTRRSARRRARSLRYGRRRAAARIDSGRYEPHPGIENFLPPGRLRDQSVALRVVEALVAAQNWRSDRREAWLAILRQLVNAMDWESGLVYAVKAEDFGAAGGRATRTVSRVIAWAVEVGLIVVAEKGASAAFLGTAKGRTPTYAVYTPPCLPQPAPKPQVNTPSSELGDLPTPCVGNYPLNGRRLNRPVPVAKSWPVFGIPGSPSERNLATRCLLQRIGLDGGGVSGVPLWRTRAQLKRWWDAGACPAGLLYAIDHHPDRPDHHRGDALRGARDPLRVLGHRLKPWEGRLHELPAAVRGIPGDYTAIPRPGVNAVSTASPPPATPWTPTSSAELRAELRAQLAELQARRPRPRRRGRRL